MSSHNTNLNLRPSIEPNNGQPPSFQTLYHQAKQEVAYYKGRIQELENEKWDANKRADDLEGAIEKLLREAEAAADLMTLADATSMLKDRMLENHEQMYEDNQATMADLKAQLAVVSGSEEDQATITDLRAQLAAASRPQAAPPRHKAARPRRQLDPNRVIKKRAPRALAVTPQPELQRSARRARFAGSYKV